MGLVEESAGQQSRFGHRPAHEWQRPRPWTCPGFGEPQRLIRLREGRLRLVAIAAKGVGRGIPVVFTWTHGGGELKTWLVEDILRSECVSGGVLQRMEGPNPYGALGASA